MDIFAPVDPCTVSVTCPGERIVHVDGTECSEEPCCPGPRIRHTGRVMDHRAYAAYARKCLRCRDACELRGIVIPEVPE